MKTVEPICATKMGPPNAADFNPAVLRTYGRPRIKGMVIEHAPNHFGRVHFAIGVERNAVILLHRQRLQAVHVISQRDPPAISQAIVPGRTRSTAHREQL